LFLLLLHLPVARASEADDADGAANTGPSLGIFQGEGDVGTVQHPGSAQYDAARGTYTVTGGGQDMWAGEDDFHFVWTKLSGDVALTADIAFVGDRGHKHRKAVLMIRQSLDGASKAVDVARHGDGLTSLQFRAADGAPDHEIQSNVSAPQTVRIEKRGDLVYAFVSGSDGKLHPSGASVKFPITGPFYIGIGVCAHDKDATETAIFSHVKLTPLAPPTSRPILYSALETVTIASGDRRVLYVTPGDLESPTWSHDGTSLAFTAHHDDDTDSYAIPAASSPDLGPQTPQKRLPGTVAKTEYPTATSFDAHPELAFDAQFVYFSTERSGHAQIWRRKPDGSAQERVLYTDTNDWSPHISPNGKWMVFLSYPPDVFGHPANQEVVLNLMSVADHKVRALATLLGGKGTIDLPSWSPDSLKLAFISYELLPSGCPQ
jgi:hypothetical protein